MAPAGVVVDLGPGISRPSEHLQGVRAVGAMHQSSGRFARYLNPLLWFYQPGEAPVAYRSAPANSNHTQGSSPTIHASCPGGITAACPALASASVPSSIKTFVRPEST